jgi:hypothetical protein
MDTETHLSHEALGDIERLPADDPRRRHLEGCARCQARWRAYRRFVEPPTDLPASELRAARERLHAALRTELDRAAGARRVIDLPLRRSALRFALASAAGLVVAAGIWVMLGPWRHPANLDTLRDVTPAARLVETERPRLAGEGRLMLAWHPVAEAEGYRVTLYSLDLSKLSERVVEGDSTLTLPLAELGAAARPGVSLYWQVAALRSGEEIATSGPVPFDVR